jgi:hypothetical protein
MNLFTRLVENIKDNPAVWLLFGALLLSGYGNWANGHHLTTICEDIGDLMAEPPLNPPRAALSAWQRREVDEIDRICGSRLAEPEQKDP